MLISKTPSAPQTTDARKSNDPKTVLSDCCANFAPCRFQLVHSGSSMRATFSLMHPDGVELRIPIESDGEFILQQAICCVSFPLRNSFCAFLGCLSDVVQQKSGDHRVIVTIPNQLIVTNLRQSFRVPVISDAGVKAVIRTSDNRKLSAKVHDISDDGMEIEFGENQDHGFSVGTGITTDLTFREETVQRRAQIRWFHETHCGLMFASPTDEEEHRQISRLHGIVLSLQQMWMKSRITQEQK